ncbi:unnamed protein product [Closterium sp. NIES-64]|nr:unnamed protein product [Closterium sp. NIES-64]CAI5963763.1 unnamed protein product [Closterium sp. NIES-64]CAI5972225.1 unnamed protein product [Closterium sp. NIES-65]
MARSVAIAVVLAALAAVICAASSVSAVTPAPAKVPAPSAKGAPVPPAAGGAAPKPAASGTAPKPAAGGAAPKPSPPPTKAQLRAELKKLSAAITAKYPKYAKYSTQVNKAINIALNSKYNLTALQSATILLLSDAVADSLALRFKGKKISNDAAYNLTAVQIVATRLTLPQLQAVKKGQLLPTQLNGVSLVKMSKAGPSVVLGQQGLAKATWSTVMDPEMYVGPYFVAHGVDNPQFPVGTKLPA